MAYNYKREDQAYGYDKDTDYSQKISEAAAAGDYAAAARYEQQRNEKIQGEGLTQYQPTSQYKQYLPKRQAQSSDDILDRILNREDFSYDLGGDALYQQYKDQYMQQGKLAMQDTVGQAAALTGGYGNSYAQTVGQQAYDQYLGRLNEVVPELYSLARSRYTQEGNDLWNLYNAFADREAQDYSREIDARNFDYQQSQDTQNSAFSLAMTMLQSGILPSDALLSNAGISAEDARAIYEKITAPSYSTSKGVKETDTTPDEDSSVFTYGNGMTMDNVASAATNYYKQNPNVAYDSRTLDMWLSQNGYYGDAAQYFKKVLVALGARNEREIGSNTDSGNS